MYFLKSPRVYEQKSYARIWETDFEKTLNDIELRNWCFSQHLNPLRGKTFINRTTGIPIVVNKNLRGEMISKIRVNTMSYKNDARIKFLSLKALKEFLIDSDPDELKIPDYKGRSKIEHSNIFKYRCKINNKEFYVKIRTRKPINLSDRVYFLYFEDLLLQKNR